ncbi:hypothetical protein DFS33DRAFT_256115 [Desarmillaria ectypa]|nr:hypothetical protein DFS33DRAFT_256115 [Desarmillaria ectypa]
MNYALLLLMPIASTIIPSSTKRMQYFGMMRTHTKRFATLVNSPENYLRLAITKMMRLSGAAQVVDLRRYRYNEGPNAIGGVLGHPFTDMIAMERLNA